jgi:hypothetical protein
VQQALKKQIISVFEPMYVDVFNKNMVGFANISARDMLDHLFSTYDNITTVDLEINFEHCAEHGTPNSQLNPCSSKIKIMQIIIRQAEASLDTRRKSTWATQKYLQLGTSWVHVSGGMKSISSRKLGHNSSPISLPLTVSTSKCRANLLQQLVTTLPTPLSDKNTR